MEQKKKVVVGMSGGVDSSVAAYLLKEQGYDVIGVTMQIWQEEDQCSLEENGGCCGLSAVEDARRVAEKLGIPYYVMNFRKEFKGKVMDYFVEEYLQGRTPNPCNACNRFIKWEALLNRCRAIGADYIATGHYAQIKQLENGRYVIQNSVTATKDQTYALYNLTQEQLSHTLMPVGAYTKEEIRAIAEKLALPIANKPDSQDICFIPDGDYRAFLDGRIGHPDRTGDFVLKDGRTLGTHSGLRNYTIGQRKGLGIAYTEPLYVISKNACDNSILLGSDSDLFTDRIYVSGCSFSGMDYPRESFRCTLTARYRGREVGATVTPLVGGRAVIELDVPLRAVTAGQSAVFYDGDVLLGGGVIE